MIIDLIVVLKKRKDPDPKETISELDRPKKLRDPSDQDQEHWSKVATSKIMSAT